MAHPMRLGSIFRPIACMWCVAGSLAVFAAEPGSDPGSGVLTTTNGRETHIRYEDLTFTGTARFVWPDGRSYSGNFVDGHPQGHGIEQYPDGSSYDGDWVDGRRDGEGTLNLADGSRYDGQFENDARSGTGMFQSHAGRYQGQWLNDMPQGMGHFAYTDGAFYDGYWGAGRRNGEGIYRRPDGSRYEGDWRNDTPDGFGRLIEADGFTYVGAWLEGERSGYGAMEIGDAFGYEGTWVANVRQGYGRELRPDGSEYVGEWHDDQRKGNGILKTPNGASHDGHWEHNSPAGSGTRVSAEGITMTGSWDGDLIASGSVKLPSGLGYDGKLYDPETKSIDPTFRAWLQRVANQGDVDAALLLGQAYRFFQQPTPDRANAILWYGRAADGGLAEAQYQLAQLLFEDSKSQQQGMALLMAAAAQGYAAANARLGVFYQLGTYVEKDHVRARQYYEIATAGGDLTARNNLAWLLATNTNAGLRNGQRAVALAQPLAVLYGAWGYLDTLAAAQAEAGEFAAAARSERKALAHAGSDTSAAALQALKQRLTLFERDEPYREP